MTLDLDQKFVPGGHSTCGVLRCREEGVHPRIEVIKQMDLYRKRRDAGSKVKVAAISERQKRVSHLWNGLKVEGMWSKQKAVITLYLVEETDCRESEFSCQVTSVDGLGLERFSVSRVGGSPQSAAEPEPLLEPTVQALTESPAHVLTESAVPAPQLFSSSALQLSAIIQQTYASLEGAIRQLQNRMDDNSRMLENRLEDKLSRLIDVIGRQGRITDTDTDAPVRVCPNMNSLDRLDENLKNFSKRLDSIEKNVAVLQTKVESIGESNSVVETSVESFKSVLETQVQDIREESMNASKFIRDSVVDAVVMSQNSILREIKFINNSEPTHPSTCERNDIRAPSLTTYRLIFPADQSSPFLCDAVTEGGGWVVIQRRSTGNVDFFQNWISYKAGFGSLDGDFWLGNQRIHTLTSRQPHELMITLKYKGVVKFAHYDSFALGNETSNYKLSIGGYSGTAGDSLHHHKDLAFSTFDRDNDLLTSNCAQQYHGAWWYRSCQSSNLNGRWGDVNQGPRWAAFSGSQPVSFSEMKIRPVPS
ncbi:ficolin-1 [Elysia marginata]|uniref:Ficolin-1 n=1 Tax=Elysia marginata TaxID=1093978 RepID=A0AAV4JCM5_9GAST|nr:ficolin-1 [Elysia marginata]